MRDLHTLQGKTIGVIYTYEGEEAPGFSHYHVWESDIISQWLMSIQQLHCRPFILDVRTFVEKAIAGTLPKLDCVLNLNCGGCELSPMALIPSICEFFKIPCIPCNAMSILAGENKRISNLIAESVGLNVPKTLPSNAKDGFFRPLNLGSSLGAKKGPLTGDEPKGVYQKFVPGYDITTPIVYNPLLDSLDFLPTVIYISEDKNTNWYLEASHKDSRCGFERQTIFQLSEELKQNYLNLIESMDISTFCRIDARIKCSSSKELNNLLCNPLKLEDVFFIEINPMPTVWINNAFSHSFSQIDKKSSFYQYVQSLADVVDEVNVYNFLLSISMLFFYNQVKK